MKSFVTRAVWSFADKIAFVAVSLGLVFWFASPMLSRMEGRHAPVVEDFVAQTVESVNGRATLSGTFTISRLACDFRAVEWFIVSPTREALIDITFGEGAQARSDPLQEFGPWTLDIPPEWLGRTRADVVHQCPFRPWQTRTSIFPPED